MIQNQSNSAWKRWIRLVQISTFLLLLPAAGCSPQASSKDPLPAQPSSPAKSQKLVIEYPADGTLFPPEIGPPTFIWNDSSRVTDTWLVQIESHHPTSHPKSLLKTKVSNQRWTPSKVEWTHMKAASKDKKLRVQIAGVQKHTPTHVLSKGAIFIRTAQDEVGAPIFFREVPLPFDYANTYPENIRYRLGHISPEIPPQVLLDNLPLCGNCHSFSKNGTTMGMDVDYANDKGSYVITDIKKVTNLTPNKIITWSDYKTDDDALTFGLLSQLSPDGRHVVSTVKDRSVFVGIKENLAYSQLFFPIKGILVSYDRETQKFSQVPGANDPKFVQSNATFTPDGNRILFARSSVYRSKRVEKSTSTILPREAVAEFIDGKKGFQYDIYSVPFNTTSDNATSAAPVSPEPLVGASNNGMSNYFPKVTPNGKWVVFTRSKNFMLLQPDSKLMIVPIEGGTPREMNCNTENMNSWHSFSPNGKWMVFASKQRGPYTQLWLTHIDDNGNDTPPVLLDHLTTKEMAANIPEFVNLGQTPFEQLVDNFSQGGNYHYRIGKNLAKYADLKGALFALNQAAIIQPDNAEVFLERGAVHYRMKNPSLAFNDFEKVIALDPHDFRGFYNLALAKEGVGDIKSALQYLHRAIQENDDNFDLYVKRATLRATHKNFSGAIADMDIAIALNPRMATLYDSRANMKLEIEDLEGALLDFKKAKELKAR